MKTQSRIALIVFGSNVTILLLFGAAIYYSLNKYSYNDFYKRLQTRASIAAKYKFQADRLNANALKAIKEQHLEKLPNEKEYLFEISGDSTLPLASAAHGLPVRFLEEIFDKGTAQLKEGNRFYTGIKYSAGNRDYLVIVSAHNYYSTHHLHFLRNVIIAGMVLMALITIAFSFYFSKRILDPIRMITLKVKQISTESIHLRLDEPGNTSEISELIQTFNDLLNRLETSFETQKNFISNASHEFGTPITSIIGEADVALIKDRKPEEYKEVLQNVLQQAERLNQITKSLLFLAQTGYKGKNLVFERVRMDEIVWNVKEVIDKLNPQNKVFVDIDLLPEDPKKLKVNGNKELLHLAIANIISNACKYSYNKPVTVSIASSSEEVILVVKDAGVGIPAAEMPFIYDPFFRASNTHLFEGYGIGLPLARNIIRLHHGQLLVSSEVNAGTTVRMTFPFG